MESILTRLSVLFLFVALMIACSPPSSTEPGEEHEQENIKSPEVIKTGSTYDDERAMRYGADDYGMKKYVIAFLKAGPNRDLSEEEANKLQAAHMKSIGRLAEEGKLLLAGPFLDDGDLRGIYIFDVETIEEAKILTETDPAIKSGSLTMELKEWYGSAAVMAVPEIHDVVAKISF